MCDLSFVINSLQPGVDLVIILSEGMVVSVTGEFRDLAGICFGYVSRLFGPDWCILIITLVVIICLFL